MFYRDYFTRAEDCDGFIENLYSNKITTQILNKKDANLFKDCFSNHVNYNCPNMDRLLISNDSPSRYITRDNLSAYFINKIYAIPRIVNVETSTTIDYENFLIEFTESSFASEVQCDALALGTNRMRFIVGNVGEGKTAFIQRIISDINNRSSKLDSKYSLLTIYFNIEDHYNYAHEPKPLKENFLELLYHRIWKEAHGRLESKIDLTKLIPVNPHERPLACLTWLISLLKRQNVRILLFIDNLDFYHYYYARYSFFEQYYKQQEESINENIMWLLSIFSSREHLGQMGLNVMVAVRDYVYNNIIHRPNGVTTDINTKEAINIDIPTEETILKTRFELLEKAIEVIVNKYPGAQENLEAVYNAAHTKLLSGQFRTTKTSIIKTINKLGQHGNRSLVAFFSSLNLTYLDYKLIERFFVRQVAALYILYFTNLNKKYSQKQNHFPNMFLVDCTVLPPKIFKDAHQPHIHTYWLKYYILKLIVKRTTIKFGEIIDIFNKIGKYDDHLVRHVTGSLCTANEFRCAEIDFNKLWPNIEARRIKPTERGKFLFSKVQDVEFPFYFQYLEVIIDDRWLSFPNKFFKSIYTPELEYSHLYETRPDIYIRKSHDSVMKKAISLLHFIRVLETTYLVEIKENKPELHSILLDNELIPNFDSIYDHIINTAESIIGSLQASPQRCNLKQLRELRNSLRSDNDLEKTFRDYYSSGIKVTS